MVCGSGGRYNLLYNVIPQKQTDLFYGGIILFLLFIIDDTVFRFEMRSTSNSEKTIFLFA